MKRLSIQSKRNNFILLSIVFFLQIVDSAVREKHISLSIVGNLKNLLLLFVLLFYIYQMHCLCKNKEDIIFRHEKNAVVVMVIVLLLLSLNCMVNNEIFTLVPFWGSVKLLLPVYVAYGVLNILDNVDIYRVMSISLTICFIAYVMTKGISNFSFKNMFAYSIVNSSISTLESNMFSPLAIAFCLYFCYFRKNIMYTVLSVFFTIFTHKRVFTLYAVVLLFVGGLLRKKKEIPKWVLVCFGLSFFIISLVYIKMNLGTYDDSIFERYLGIDLDAFNMGRKWLFQNAIYHGYKSAGLYTLSSSDFVMRSPEMDLPNFYLEMGVISVVVWIFTMLKITNANTYNFVASTFILFELLTSHWSDITYFWILYYITLGSIVYENKDIFVPPKVIQIKFPKISLKIR